MQVRKADGTFETYKESKVADSINRAGIPLELQNQIVSNVNSRVYDNIPTSEIYNHVVNFLEASKQPYFRSKYSLKQSIMQLGPTGYPFEDFVAKLLELKGYSVAVRQIIRGKCISHEIDVIATLNGKKILIEAKFHNEPGTRSDVHVPMYVKSRFEDVKENNHFDEAWIITNTKATSDAIDFSNCVGMKIITWSYPERENLRDMVETFNMHPVTMLTTLNQNQKAELINNHIVLCNDIHTNNQLLDIIHLPNEQKNKVIEELKLIH